MKILFMGTPDFAVLCLEQMIADGHEIVGVVSQPDKPKGRRSRCARWSTGSQSISRYR